jgi:hypothetical protein
MDASAVGGLCSTNLERELQTAPSSESPCNNDVDSGRVACSLVQAYAERHQASD